MCAILISEALSLAHVNEKSRSFTCHPYIYPHIPSRRASPHFGRYSFSVPLRVGG